MFQHGTPHVSTILEWRNSFLWKCFERQTTTSNMTTWMTSSTSMTTMTSRTSSTAGASLSPHMQHLTVQVARLHYKNSIFWRCMACMVNTCQYASVSLLVHVLQRQITVSKTTSTSSTARAWINKMVLVCCGFASCTLQFVKLCRVCLDHQQLLGACGQKFACLVMHCSLSSLSSSLQPCSTPIIIVFFIIVNTPHRREWTDMALTKHLKHESCFNDTLPAVHAKYQAPPYQAPPHQAPRHQAPRQWPHLMRKDFDGLCMIFLMLVGGQCRFADKGQKLIATLKHVLGRAVLSLRACVTRKEKFSCSSQDRPHIFATDFLHLSESARSRLAFR